MTNQSLEAFVKRAERLQGITACVICSGLRLEWKKELCKTGDEIQNSIHLVLFCETLITCFVSDQKASVSDELSVKPSIALTQGDKVSRLCLLASIIKAEMYLIVDSIKRNATPGLMVMRESLEGQVNAMERRQQHLERVDGTQYVD
jgi:hypothetical protein